MSLNKVQPLLVNFCGHARRNLSAHLQLPWFALANHKSSVRLGGCGSTASTKTNLGVRVCSKLKATSIRPSQQTVSSRFTYRSAKTGRDSVESRFRASHFCTQEGGYLNWVEQRILQTGRLKHRSKFLTHSGATWTHIRPEAPGGLD